MDKTFYVLVGAPGSGKSTICAKLIEHLNESDYVISSTDGIREEWFGSAEILRDHGKVFDEFYRRIEEGMNNGKSVVIADSTAARSNYRARLTDIGRKFSDYKIKAVHFDLPLETILFRNKNRSRFVPEEVIANMHKNIFNYPPRKAEGFHEIITIKE